MSKIASEGDATSNIHMPLIYIVVLNYNSFEDTFRCVRSLENIEYSNFKIVIIDNASPDSSGKKLLQSFPNHTTIISDHNGGYAYGNNLGIQYSLKNNAEFVLILNNDTTVSPELLIALLDPFKKYREVGITTCKVLYERTNNKYASAGWISNALCAIIPLNESESNRETSVTYISGCAMLVKRSVFEKVGYLNERFFMYFEDVDFCLTVKKYYNLIYTPHSTIFHRSGGGDKWSNYSSFYLYYSARNRILTFSKNPLSKIHVMITNMINIVMKVTVLVIHASSGKPVNLRSKISALVRGAADGFQGKIGRNVLY